MKTSRDFFVKAYFREDGNRIVRVLCENCKIFSPKISFKIITEKENRQAEKSKNQSICSIYPLGV